MTKRRLEFDRIGYWSEVKLEIIRKYAAAYSTILARQHRLTHYYIDGFAGAGVHESRTTGSVVPGSPLIALGVQPPFAHYFLVDLDGNRVSGLREAIGGREDVSFYEGDCNRILVEDILPRVRYDHYRRALCLLDPYGLQLDWDVIQMAGRLETVDLFLNFPIMDMNRNALWTRPESVDPDDVARMTAFWGDESWRAVAYRPSRQNELFGDAGLVKQPNRVIVDAFCERLRSMAGFRHTPDPMPMRNSQNAVVYYLCFASQNEVASRIATQIFRRHTHQGPRHG